VRRSSQSSTDLSSMDCLSASSSTASMDSKVSLMYSRSFLNLHCSMIPSPAAAATFPTAALRTAAASMPPIPSMAAALGALGLPPKLRKSVVGQCLCLCLTLWPCPRYKLSFKCHIVYATWQILSFNCVSFR
jgi:hypothetical protein